METNTPEYVQSLSDDHPVRIYINENSYLKQLLAQLAQVDIIKDYQLAYNLFNQIAAVDIRYTRKENQLFPYLEKRGWFGPSQGMWNFHDENRKLISGSDWSRGTFLSSTQKRFYGFRDSRRVPHRPQKRGGILD
jgi:DUF438 domain-containing protein